MVGQKGYCFSREVCENYRERNFLYHEGSFKNARSIGMNKALIFFILIAVTGNVHAQQTEIDSLLKALPHAAQGKPRIDLLNKIAYSYTLLSVEEAEKFVKQSLLESRASRYNDGLAKAYRLLGSIYYIRGEYNLATEYDYNSLKLYEKLGDLWGCAGLLNSLAMVSAEQREYDKVYERSESVV